MSMTQWLGRDGNTYALPEPAYMWATNNIEYVDKLRNVPIYTWPISVGPDGVPDDTLRSGKGTILAYGNVGAVASYLARVTGHPITPKTVQALVDAEQIGP